MPDDNQELKDVEETGADDGEEDYDQWENELNQEKRRAIVVNAEQEKEKGQSLASNVAGNLLKSQIKKSFWKIVLKSLIPVALYGLLALLILLIIFILYYFIVNPCELARIVGEWWATAVGAMCTAVGK